jgi:hypothetical protein
LQTTLKTVRILRKGRYGPAVSWDRASRAAGLGGAEDASCLRAPNNGVVVVVTLAKPLERFPIRWNHLIEKESLQLKELERVLMRHRIYPMSKYRKSRSTFSGHALARVALAVLTRGGTCVGAREATAA